MAVMKHKGKPEMEQANGILRRYGSPDIPPVPSPGRAALVLRLFELGRRGDDLDWRIYDDRWVELKNGSSSCQTDQIVIHADAREVVVHILDWLPKIYRAFGESPDSLPAMGGDDEEARRSSWSPYMKVRDLAERFQLSERRMSDSLKEFQKRSLAERRGKRGRWRIKLSELPPQSLPKD